MVQLYVLHEHASGFAIFRTTEFEEIAVFLPQVRESICNISKFRSIVYLVAFQPFKEQKNALQNFKSIILDELSIDLQLFLENNIPRTKKSKQAVALGVASASLASAISDKLGINCISSLVVQELIRGVRLHFPKLIKGFKDMSYLEQSEKAMAHHYSKEKINFDFIRQDSMIMESCNLTDELEKDIRNSTQRLKGWYSEHFPELKSIIQNVELYVKCVDTIGDRQNMPEDIEEKLSFLVEDASKVQAILQAAHNSMGMDISSVDLDNIKMFCQRVLSLIKKKQENLDYLTAKMNATAPNISALIGESVGSRLICRAGGLRKLAVLPASTVQILGADKKLFRSKIGKERICGLLTQVALVGKAQKKNKVSRFLSNKCSLAARIDCFRKKGNESYGSELLQQVEKMMKGHENKKTHVTVKEKLEQNIAVEVKKTKSEKCQKSNEDIEPVIYSSMDGDISLELTEKTFEENALNSSKIVGNFKENKNIIKSHISQDNSNLNSNDEVTKSKRRKGVKECVSNSDEELELSDESTEIEQIKKPVKKRKSKVNDATVAVEDLDEVASDMHEMNIKTKTPLRKRKKSINAKGKNIKT